MKLPAQLKASKTWLVWKLVKAEGDPKPRKIPYYINGLARGTDPDKTTRHDQGSDYDRANLATFDQALARFKKGGCSGVGFATVSGSGVVALDFDNCVTDGVIAPYVAPFMEDTYSEISPSGTGIRIFMSGDLGSFKDTKAERGPFAVEVFGDSGYVTVTGNVTDTCSMFELQETASPVNAATLKMMASRGWPIGGSRSRVLALGGDSDIADLADLDTSVRRGVTHDEIRAELALIPANRGREEWVKVLAAIHHETQGSEAGFQLALEWSKSGDESFKGEADVRGRWRSFGPTQHPTTFVFILKLSAEGKKNLTYEARAEHAAQIAASPNDFDLRERICVAIAADVRLVPEDRNILATSLAARLKGLGTPLTLANCRKLVTPQRAARERGMPDWALAHCYVTDKDEFYREDSEEWLSKQGFNAKYSRFVEDADMDAATLALNVLHLKTVTRAMYLPWAGPYFDIEGIDCVNTYRPSSVPEAADAVGASGREAVEAVTRHLSMMVSGRKVVLETLLSYVAHNVQFPGVKIRWSPLIKGVEGDGKSLLGNLISAVMGRANVKQVSPHELGSTFSDWAEGACVSILEEVKLTGANKFDVFNALKPYITNDTVRVVPKGSKGRDIHNVTNYVGFTNHNDALPLNDNDRRWMIIFSPFNNKEELAKAIGGDTGKYFDRLIGLIASQRAELRRYFLDYEISDHFKPNSHAPETAERKIMISMATSDVELIVRGIIENGAPGVAAMVLSTRHLRAAVGTQLTEREFNTSALSNVMGKIGWLKFPGQVKWNGTPEHLWFRGGNKLDNAQARAALDATMVEAVGQGSGATEDGTFDPFDH